MNRVELAVLHSRPIFLLLSQVGPKVADCVVSSDIFTPPLP